MKWVIWGHLRKRITEYVRAEWKPRSGLNLVTAAIVLWNTVYLERATTALRDAGRLKDESMLQFLAPLGWEHINLTGDYVWRLNRKSDEASFGR